MLSRDLELIWRNSFRRSAKKLMRLVLLACRPGGALIAPKLERPLTAMGAIILDSQSFPDSSSLSSFLSVGGVNCDEGGSAGGDESGAVTDVGVVAFSTSTEICCFSRPSDSSISTDDDEEAIEAAVCRVNAPLLDVNEGGRGSGARGVVGGGKRCDAMAIAAAVAGEKNGPPLRGGGGCGG